MYGLLIRFDTPDELIDAVRRARNAGMNDIEAYTPFPLPELMSALPQTKSRVPFFTLLGGMVGAITGFALQWYTASVDYPLNIGGRPLFSWPAFIPITFELTILGACFSAVISMLLLNGLPRLNHPLFQIHEFDMASRSSFFLCLRLDSPEGTSIIEFIDALQPRQYWEVS